LIYFPLPFPSSVFFFPGPTVSLLPFYRSCRWFKTWFPRSRHVLSHLRLKAKAVSPFLLALPLSFGPPPSRILLLVFIRSFLFVWENSFLPSLHPPPPGLPKAWPNPAFSLPPLSPRIESIFSSVVSPLRLGPKLNAK